MRCRPHRLVPVLALATGCATVYHPGAANVAMLSEPGELEVMGAFGSAGVQGGATLAVGPHLAPRVRGAVGTTGTWQLGGGLGYYAAWGRGFEPGSGAPEEDGGAARTGWSAGVALEVDGGRVVSEFRRLFESESRVWTGSVWSFGAVGHAGFRGRYGAAIMALRSHTVFADGGEGSVDALFDEATAEFIEPSVIFRLGPPEFWLESQLIGSIPVVIHTDGDDSQFGYEPFTVTLGVGASFRTRRE